MTKTELRTAVRAKVRAIQAAERTRLSELMRETMKSQSEWQEAASVLLFSALPDEPDLGELLTDALKTGKQVALPRFDDQTGMYVAAATAGPQDLVAGRFGAIEPGPRNALVSLNQLDFAFIPGIAFDLAGRRLGRGKGFYDRLLAEVRGHKCGVCFDAQVVAAVPEEPHDVRVDSILTPTRWQKCQPVD
jgi:5-formyltetrahydrofolate cyclo-ligase